MKTIVVGVGLKSELVTELKEDLVELEQLVMAMGGEVAGFMVQQLPAFNPGTLIGSGKLEELKKLVDDTQADMVVIDHHLSGVQTRNLETFLGKPVKDRSQIILSIFAQRARTYEGKLQVELAQCLDQMPRMINAWHGSLSRQGGGLGSKGPGETALELDRRRLRDRIATIREKLEGVSKHRKNHRSSRKRQDVASFALIGYTNSGKSTLLNTLTQSNVFAQDQVFATLDPTTRQLYLPELGTQAVLTDTVGFIKKLPPQLIEAFKATLEETTEADILLHVVDLSSPQMHKQMDVVQKLIEEFGWQSKPIIHVFNKLDQAPLEKQFQVSVHPRVFVSAKTGQGLERLKQLMQTTYQSLKTRSVQLYFPREQEYRIFDLGKSAQIIRQEKGSYGTVCYAEINSQGLQDFEEFMIG
jgi:GTP-binding protein HflX